MSVQRRVFPETFKREAVDRVTAKEKVSEPPEPAPPASTPPRCLPSKHAGLASALPWLSWGDDLYYRKSCGGTPCRAAG
jgi:hypothetical protein